MRAKVAVRPVSELAQQETLRMKKLPFGKRPNSGRSNWSNLKSVVGGKGDARSS